MHSSALLLTLSCTLLGTLATPIPGTTVDTSEEVQERSGPQPRTCINTNGNINCPSILPKDVPSLAKPTLAIRAGATDSTVPKTSAESIVDAANDWAKDVDTVSDKMSALRLSSGPFAVTLANEANQAEADEGGHKDVLAKAAGTAGNAAISALEVNAPKVVEGFQNIINNPSPENVIRQLTNIQNIRFVQISSSSLSSLLPQLV